MKKYEEKIKFDQRGKIKLLPDLVNSNSAFDLLVHHASPAPAQGLSLYATGDVCLSRRLTSA